MQQPESPLHQIETQASLYFGPYYVNGTASSEFPNFSHFKIEESNAIDQPKTGDYVNVAGAVHTKSDQTYRFTDAKLGRGPRGFDKLTFSTEKVGGVVYRFQGTFLKVPELVPATHNYTKLRGVLIMEKNGKNVAEARLDFFVWKEA